MSPSVPAGRSPSPSRSETAAGSPFLRVVESGEIDIGERLRAVRTGRRLSIRALAELTGLNVNTLSLIENGRTSPSVSTLQQQAQGLHVPVTEIFEVATGEAKVVSQRAGQRTLHRPPRRRSAGAGAGSSPRRIGRLPHHGQRHLPLPGLPSTRCRRPHQAGQRGLMVWSGATGHVSECSCWSWQACWPCAC